ncbi:hypothetical protein B0H11DRAFT_1934754 [Mycena galericulata]|nr:hypothetical protein B0H11DRAFT_1934754 [Mycena galericulata]
MRGRGVVPLMMGIAIRDLPASAFSDNHPAVGPQSILSETGHWATLAFFASGPHTLCIGYLYAGSWMKVYIFKAKQGRRMARVLSPQIKTYTAKMLARRLQLEGSAGDQGSQKWIPAFFRLVPS